jgi:hypothetical protein
MAQMPRGAWRRRSEHLPSDYDRNNWSQGLRADRSDDRLVSAVEIFLSG